MGQRARGGRGRRGGAVAPNVRARFVPTISTPGGTVAMPERHARYAHAMLALLCLAAALAQPPAVPAAQAPAPAPPTAPGVPATIRIATWNIEWLGQSSKRSGLAANVAQKPEDIAEYIAASGAAVVAVQEVVAGGDRPRSGALESAARALDKRTGGGWRYTLFPGRNPEPAQLTGILWDSARLTPVTKAGKRLGPEAGPADLLAAAVKVDLPRARGTRTRLWNKPPYALKFSTGEKRTDFVLVVIHMKSDYNEDHALTREEEAQNLLDALPALRKALKDEDVVIAGDTNTTRADEKALRLLTAARLVDANVLDAPTTWRDGRMDKLFFPAAQPEFNDRAGDVLGARYLESKGWRPADFKRHLSDHYLVSTTLTITADDD